MRHRPTPRTILACTLAPALALLTAGTAMAQMQHQETAARLQEIQQRLATAQGEALEANPELKTRHEELQALVVETMEAEGYDPETRMETLDTIRGQVRDPSLSDAERQQLMAQARQAHQSLQQAQQVAMQDGTVAAAEEAFREELMAAMRAQDPETDALLEEAQRLQTQLQSGATPDEPQGGAPSAEGAE